MRYINLVVSKLIIGLTTTGDLPVRVHLIRSSGNPGAAQGEENA